MLCTTVEVVNPRKRKENPLRRHQPPMLCTTVVRKQVPGMESWCEKRKVLENLALDSFPPLLVATHPEAVMCAPILTRPVGVCRHLLGERARRLRNIGPRRSLLSVRREAPPLESVGSLALLSSRSNFARRLRAGCIPTLLLSLRRHDVLGFSVTCLVVLRLPCSLHCRGDEFIRLVLLLEQSLHASAPFVSLPCGWGSGAVWRFRACRLFQLHRRSQRITHASLFGTSSTITRSQVTCWRPDCDWRIRCDRPWRLSAPAMHGCSRSAGIMGLLPGRLGRLA